jgi:non-specific serine/threonine protein kinase
LPDAIAVAFERGTSEGLFALAATKPFSAGPSFAFWRELGALYLARLCQTPDVEGALDPVEPPSGNEAEEIVSGAPPMTGAEYLTVETVCEIWRALDAWTRAEVAAAKKGLPAFLEERAPLWHRVGRVCLHLAENKSDPEHPFAFLATYATGLSADGRVRYRPLSAALEEKAGAGNRGALIQLLSPVQAAAERSALAAELVESGDLYHPLAWTPGEAHRFLVDVPLFEESGLLVRLPDWWRKRPRPRVSVTIGEAAKSRLRAESLLDFRVELAIGDRTLTDEEVCELLACDDGLVLLKGQWIEVDRGRLAEALEHWRKVEEQAADGIDFAEGMRLLAGAPAELDPDASLDTDREWAHVGAGAWLKGVLERLRAPERAEAPGPGAGLRGELRPYQRTGLAWLQLLSGLGLGACLADDMGLGKTIQVIALLLQRKRKKPEHPSLFVLPASLLSNWKAELERFAPSIRTLFLHPSETKKAELEAARAAPDEALAGVDAVFTTYATLARQDWLSTLDWDLVVLDEAQAIKNPAARQTRAVKRLRSRARIALTGTPVENRLSDLWSIFDFLSPGLLGSAARFKAFVKALEERGGGYAPLRELVRPYILRRLKTDARILPDLPDKTEVHAFCALSRRQARLYQRSVEELGRAVNGVSGMKRRGLVLSFLLRFQQICNHPSQLVGDGAYEPAHSGKFERLREICEELASRQEKALVFTQFRELTEPLSAFLARVFGRPGLTLHGGTPVGKRRALVDEFQDEDGPPFFVLSLKAGGTGLNLTAASHVIHFDRWWNPAVENQATDRAFRIGQRRNVLVHKLVCRGTVEERIDELIGAKSSLAEDLLAGGAEKLVTEMSDEELIELVSLDVSKVRV